MLDNTFSKGLSCAYDTNAVIIDVILFRKNAYVECSARGISGITFERFLLLILYISLNILQQS